MHILLFCIHRIEWSRSLVTTKWYLTKAKQGYVQRYPTVTKLSWILILLFMTCSSLSALLYSPDTLLLYATMACHVLTLMACKYFYLKFFRDFGPRKYAKADKVTDKGIGWCVFSICVLAVSFSGTEVAYIINYVDGGPLKSLLLFSACLPCASFVVYSETAFLTRL